MPKVIWRRYTVDDIAFLKGRKQEWKDNPGKMRELLAKATLAASVNKRARRERVIDIARQVLPLNPVQTPFLADVLRTIIKLNLGKEHRVRANEIKALRTMLVRYGVISFDPVTCLWRLNVC